MVFHQRLGIAYDWYSYLDYRGNEQWDYKVSHNLLCKVHVWRIRERDFVNGSGKEPGLL